MWRGAWSNRGWVWLAAGLAIGLAMGGWWPQAPIHAVATDRYETFAVATGPVDSDLEAFYLLDFLTGDLQGVVLSQNGGFIANYSVNILQDFQVTPGKNPKFLMVTGLISVRRGAGGARPAASAVYVAETNSGIVTAYGIPWAREKFNTNQAIRGPMVKMGQATLRRADMVRPAGT